MQAVQQIDARGKSGAAATQTSPEQRRMEAKLILKLGQWMADTGQGGRSDITGQTSHTDTIKLGVTAADLPASYRTLDPELHTQGLLAPIAAFSCRKH